MWGARYFTARYWTARFFSATGADVVVPANDKVMTIAEFRAPQTTARLKSLSMNGIITAPSMNGRIR